MTGGEGEDFYSADAGDDSIDSFDGVGEEIDCGDDTDSYFADLSTACSRAKPISMPTAMAFPRPN